MHWLLTKEPGDYWGDALHPERGGDAGYREGSIEVEVEATEELEPKDKRGYKTLGSRRVTVIVHRWGPEE